MQFLISLYDSFGVYLFIIGIPMLFEIISVIYQHIKHRKNAMVFQEKCKLLIKVVFVCVFVLGYLLFILFMADTQSRATFIKIGGSIIPIASVIGVLGYIIYKKNQKQKSNKESLSKCYLIESEKYLCWLFSFFGVCSIGLFIYSIYTHEELWVIIFLSIISAAMLIAALSIGLWKIEVNDMEIIYRSTFGRIRKYNFKDITKGVYKKSGAFRVYIGDKRIFTFDDNMEFSLFIEQMKRLHIPVWSYEFSVKMKNKSK